MPKNRVKVFHFTETEKQQLDRFGCSFDPRAGVFHFDWRGNSPNDALKASIFASLGRAESREGPLILLAFDVSVVRPLPRYAYFPFDLTDEAHRKYLDRLTTTGELRICFVCRNRAIERRHQLSVPLRVHAREGYEESLNRFEEFGRERWRLEGPLRLMERWIRIPDFLERFFLDEDFDELQQQVDVTAKAVPQATRDAAMSVVREAEQSFRPFYAKNRKPALARLLGVRDGVTCIRDLDRRFLGDPEGLKDFLAKAIASTFSIGERENIREAMKLASPFFERAADAKDEIEAKKLIAKLKIPRELVNLLRLILVVRRISPNSLSRLAGYLGVEVEKKIGRPTKDYSREYELKMSGLSWSAVARRAVDERPELREELGGVPLDEADPVRRIQMINRIRQGVIADAKRTGKPLPSEVDDDGEQKSG
jgi:hypothetical protein